MSVIIFAALVMGIFLLELSLKNYIEKHLEMGKKSLSVREGF